MNSLEEWSNYARKWKSLASNAMKQPQVIIRVDTKPNNLFWYETQCTESKFTWSGVLTVSYLRMSGKQLQPNTRKSITSKRIICFNVRITAPGDSHTKRQRWRSWGSASAECWDRSAPSCAKCCRGVRRKWSTYYRVKSGVLVNEVKCPPLPVPSITKGRPDSTGRQLKQKGPVRHQVATIFWQWLWLSAGQNWSQLAIP